MANCVYKYLRMVDKYQKSIKLCVAQSSCRAEIFETLQTYKGFSRVIYSILNGSAILERNETRLERNETRLERNETRLERNETRLERNETRGGKLPLSGTVRSCARSVPILATSQPLGFKQKTALRVSTK